SWEVNKEAARVHFRKRELELAARHLETAVSMMEADPHAWARLVTCYQALGQRAALRTAAQHAIAQAEQVLAHDPSNGSAMSFGALGHAALGQQERAFEWMERAMLIDSDNLDMRYNFACLLATYVGEPERALKFLERYLAAVGGFQINLVEA